MEIAAEIISLGITIKAMADRVTENKEQAANLARRCAGFEGVCRKLQSQRGATAANELHGLKILRDTLVGVRVLLQSWATPRSERYGRVMRGVAFVKRIAYSADEMEALTKINEDLQRASDLLQAEVQIDTAGEMATLKRELMAMREEQQGGLSALLGSFQALQASQTPVQIAAAVKALSHTAGVEDAKTARELGIDQKEAFVVGIQSYKGQPLRTCVNDATDVAAKLRGIGFHTTTALDVTLDEFEAQLLVFKKRLGPGCVALFFFSGHGCQHGSRN